MNITCYIVDDEYHVISTLREYISEVPYLELIGFNSNPEKGLTEVNRLGPDLVFLDVNMPALDGMDFCQLITTATKVVFVSGYRDYAFDAFSHNAVDYLLKPVSHKRFMQAIHKVISFVPMLGKSNAQTAASEISYIYIKHGIKGRLIKIEFDDIYYVESNDNHVIFNLENESYTAYIPLKNVLPQLPESSFLRIHKSFVVNHNKINHIEGNMVILKNKTILQLGNTYKDSFFKYVGLSVLKTNK
ncbi:DNA-binding LytR/AlgR family response regulator [Pedobacter cryoconitis]|uniref:DNA-binding LytR/AlgR family response regulator n=1 Tax=Pedobacter cryoconitis TaxID=188932 RepID=A0A7W9DYT7_9SPHI|nr:LytTR family DNA-binding domain-containing protein [Pedobacter cryoconitis]MBB5634855.1 DNA-binding LytR/AlgR family response regulator [Pedobacter cryoconitis]MBB6272012.1 DNA-binding LytR/AlgR family response regulator [Pedobacter cryoconitis]